MASYNPKIYNYKNLQEADRIVIQAEFSLIEVIENKAYDFPINENTSYLEKIFNQTALATLREVLDAMLTGMIEQIVDMIDEYPYTPDEIETKNYFYGYPGKIGL